MRLFFEVILPAILAHVVTATAILAPPATLLFACLLLHEAIKALRGAKPWLPGLLKAGCYFVFFLKLILL